MNEGQPRMRNENLSPVSIDSPVAQIELAKKAFPGLESNELMNHWIMDKQPDGYSMAEHFRGFVEDPKHATDRVDLKDPAELEKLLEDIKKYPPTVH